MQNSRVVAHPAGAPAGSGSFERQRKGFAATGGTGPKLPTAPNQFRFRGAMLLAASMLAAAVGGCQGAQLKTTTIDVASTIQAIQQKQVIDNFGRILRQPYLLPSQVALVGGVVQIVNTVSPSVSFPLTSTFARTVGASLSTATTTAGAGATIGGSVMWEENFTIQPITDPSVLKALWTMYYLVLFEPSDPSRDAWITRNYRIPLASGKDGNGAAILVPDPYYMEIPNCVLCFKPEFLTEAEHDAKLLPKDYSDIDNLVAQHNIEANDVFKYRWLFWRDSRSPDQGLKPCDPTKNDTVDWVGSNNGYDFYVSDGVHTLLPTCDPVGDKLDHPAPHGQELFSDFMLLTLEPQPSRPPAQTTIVPR